MGESGLSPLEHRAAITTFVHPNERRSALCRAVLRRHAVALCLGQRAWQTRLNICAGPLRGASGGGRRQLGGRLNSRDGYDHQRDRDRAQAGGQPEREFRRSRRPANQGVIVRLREEPVEARLPGPAEPSRVPTAFGETLVRVPSVTDVLSTDVLVRARSELVTTRPLRLYPLLDEGVSAHGLSFTELHGSDYASTWQVSAEIHAHTNADGILYTSRFSNRQCVALFDRAKGSLLTTLVAGVARTSELAADLASRFGKHYVEP